MVIKTPCVEINRNKRRYKDGRSKPKSETDGLCDVGGLGSITGALGLV